MKGVQEALAVELDHFNAIDHDAARAIKNTLPQVHTNVVRKTEKVQTSIIKTEVNGLHILPMYVYICINVRS